MTTVVTVTNAAGSHADVVVQKIAHTDGAEPSTAVDSPIVLTAGETVEVTVHARQSVAIFEA